MRKRRISNKWAYRLLYALGMVLCIVPSTVTICQLFPVWQEESYATLASGITVSGLSVFLLLLSSVPMLREVCRKIKTPSAWMMWLIAGALCMVVEQVIGDLVIVCLVSFVGSALGAGCFWASSIFKVKAESEKLEEGEADTNIEEEGEEVSDD